MGATDDTRGRGVRARSSQVPVEPDGEDRLSDEVSDDLAVSEDDDVSPDAADDDTSGFAADADAVDLDDDEPPWDAPLGLTSVRLPARGRRRGRPGTIF